MNNNDSGTVLVALADGFDEWLTTVAIPTHERMSSKERCVASFFFDNAQRMSIALREMAAMIPHASEAIVSRAIKNNRTTAKDSTRDAEAKIMSSQSNVTRASL